MKICNKRGASEDVAWPEIIFIVLLLIFMFTLMVFVRNTVSGNLLQEEIYAKKIALILDGAKPDSIIELDVTDITRKAKEKEKDIVGSDIVYLKDGKVFVSLRSQGKSYSIAYFSDYKINVKKNVYGVGDKTRYSYIFEVKENE